MQSWNVFNPFATRFTRPGEIPFLPPPELDLAEIGARFEQANWIGQIVGPHGVGKTTLALAFRERQSRFSKSRHLIFRSGPRFWWPDSFQIQPAYGSVPEWSGKSLDAYWRGQVLVIVDGWENLSRLNRYLLRRHCRQTASGLIITSHQPIRSLPVLARFGSFAGRVPRHRPTFVAAIVQRAGRRRNPTGLRTNRRRLSRSVDAVVRSFCQATAAPFGTCQSVIRAGLNQEHYRDGNHVKRIRVAGTTPRHRVTHPQPNQSGNQVL